MIVFVDFETYYNEKSHYSLRDMPTLQYIRDPRFKVLGMSFAREIVKVLFLNVLIVASKIMLILMLLKTSLIDFIRRKGKRT